ncbi:MAG TPA: aquaporin [Candidatus Saccharimonadales bacterium]|nr:aquaporin [Candidatus Saccharimonadales bacterium]
MATKKAASTAKSSTKKADSSKQSTKLTTVKVVESAPVLAPTSNSRSGRIGSAAIAALVSEFVGTFIFAATVVASQGQPILVMFALAGVVLAVGGLSGAYLNPALTIGAWVTRRLTPMRALGYIVAQFLGAMLALVVLTAFSGNAAQHSATDVYSNTPTLFQAAAIPSGKEWIVFMSEVLGAIIFGFAVANATREAKDRTTAALTVGIGLFLGLMVAGSAASFVGGSAILNPAVAVTLQAINLTTVWPLLVYIIGAGVGATIGFVLFDLIRNAEPNKA